MRRASLLLTAVSIAASLSCVPASQAPYATLRLEELRDADGWYHLPTFRYKGAIRNGLPDGVGTAIYADGMRVDGTFRAGVAEGTATVMIPGQGTFVGAMTGGRMPRGELTATNGDYYRGDLVAWRPEGAGLLVHPDESRYTGSFRAGLPDGPGVAYDPSTDAITEGTFAAGLLDGPALRSRAGVPSLRDYQAGRDVTAEALAARAADLAFGPLDADIAARRSEAGALEADLGPLRTQRDRLRDARTTAGIDRFNQDCKCHLSASLERDGSVSVFPHACLTVTSGDASDAQRKQFEERMEAEGRVCSAWAKDITDPALPSRLAEVNAEFNRKAAALRASEEAQRRAEEDRRRLQRELQQREGERVRALIARAEAESAAEAERRDLERRRRCSTRSNCCYCAIYPRGTKPADMKCAPCI